MPVKTIAMPRSLAAAMTSSSRMLPPGWITATAPLSATTSRPSRNGKNASDAFFPFRDGLDVVADNGAVAVIQPGGSMRDEEGIAAANERGIAMVFTGIRHFRH